LAPGSSLRHFLARFAIAIVVVLGATGAAVALGNGRFEKSFDDIRIVDLEGDVLVPQDAGEPSNYLVIGTDSRAFVDSPEEATAFGSEGEVGGQRSDAIMVVHIDPPSRTGFVISFPRDLWVDIPGHGEGRINTALGLGGPSLIIETIDANFHIEIAHYLEVDFAGFRQIVDTIGGVHIWFNTPARDNLSGLNIEEPGCRELDGGQALAYVRSRHYQWYDDEAGKWRDDPRSDLSRIERQQYFVRSLAATALGRSARNPTTAFALLDDVSGSLGRDPDLELADLKALINAFRDLDPASIEMATLPVESADRGGAEVLVPLEPDVNAVLSRLWRGGLPPGMPSMAAAEDTSVLVRNGSGVSGRAADVLDAFVAHGFEAGGPVADADRDDHPVTQVRWRPGHGGQGLAVVSALGSPNAAEAGPEDELGDADVLVIVGRDWDDLAAPIKESAGTTAAPTTRPQAPTTAASTTTSTTTTTSPPSPSDTAAVPVDPETGGPLVGCP
jgi:LCP family protein required for cell wall assembly